VSARSQRRGRSGFAPDSLFTRPGRLPFQSPAPQDFLNLGSPGRRVKDADSHHDFGTTLNLNAEGGNLSVARRRSFH
jgi:hypothetical protein